MRKIKIGWKNKFKYSSSLGYNDKNKKIYQNKLLKFIINVIIAEY